MRKVKKTGADRMKELGYSRVDAWLRQEELARLAALLDKLPHVKRSQFIRWAILRGIIECEKDTTETRRAIMYAR